MLRAPNWVGDFVMATPLFEAALASLYFTRVSIALRAHLSPLLAGGPCAGHVVELVRGRSETELYRALAPDAIVLLTNSFAAAWRALRARI
ncbi:MAG: hypothetical protein HOP15_00660, partial [Planctomycetes bacterium]|nr:hypothetical protein [Planctomycetota bacterium]